MTVKVYEAKSLIDSMEARSKSYNDLRGKLEQVKSQFNDIVNLDDQLQGKGAESIKGFFHAQMDVAEAWLRLIDRNIAFFNGIAGTAEDKNLSGDTVVHVPFLDDELTHHARSHKEMVSSQRDELKRIFNRIDDLISLDAFSKEQFDDHMEKAEKDRKDTADAVDQIDNDLKSEYILSEGDEQYVVALFQQLMEASRQGSNIQPIHFNAEAYKASDVYKLKEQAEQQTKEYLSFKDEQEKFREQLKRQEELENRPWYEKTWDGVKTFTGELTGYYDYIRASEGVDPVTGEKLTTGQRVAAGAMAAAGFIPVVGWAGRIVKGGGAIYKTAKGMHAADQALDVYRTANTFSTLEKAEMGIYGLVSANGFSEYITGKDMFGNELTEEQQKNSLYQALGLLAVGGGAYYLNKLQAENAVYQVPNIVKNNQSRIEYLRNKYGKLTPEELHNRINTRGIHEEAIRFGSKKTWDEFLENSKGTDNIGEIKNSYIKLIKEQSPWPEGFTPKRGTLKSGDTFEMVLDNAQPLNKPGSFGTFDKITGVEYAKNNLAIKSNWKEDFGKVVTYRVKTGVELQVLEGPVGPQIDIAANKYLPGGGTQIQILLDWKENKMNYLEVVSVRSNK
ncbi:ribonuclease YeeF family protein [Metabacillus sp. FJAT-53654]|uniref:T7SS effector LXG polymorphic toxin n=1 Tax=Metabacillus rhizosphaerae TaxID=3117747 RepID=A0ABZ2MVM0_9BACI